MKKLSFKAFLPVILFLLYSLFTAQSFANELKGVRVWPSPDKTRVVLDLITSPKYEIHYLKKPNRLVVDLQSTKNKSNLKAVKHKGSVVNNVRTSKTSQQSVLRLVFDLNYETKAKYFSLPPINKYGHRLVIDLPHKKIKKAIKPTKTTKLKKIKKAREDKQQPIGRDVIIAVDAGHGGEDPGASGKYTQEKKVTLQIAKRVVRRINKQKGMSAFLVRKGDYYVGLGKRSEIAKKEKADFLVSIHADGFTSSQPSGASVWILSNRRANTEEESRMRRHEMHSELLGGEKKNNSSNTLSSSLNNIFFSMSQRNSMEVGSKVGHLVVKELKQVTHMHKRKPVAASLAVLKSPYVPSILVEAGFITNRKEERLLNKSSFQIRIAEAVFKGIYKHFSQSTPDGTYFAQQKRAKKQEKHTVRNGESLSLIAERYSISSSKLKSYNKLRSVHLKVGQVLKIPANYQLVVRKEKKKPRKLLLTNEKYFGPTVHIVQRGESLSFIASKYKSSISALKKFNKLRSTSLAIGQKIKIPKEGYKAPKIVKKPIVYRVKSGDSLSVIAHSYGKTSTELKKYNHLKSTSVWVGQRIKIPSDGQKVESTPDKKTPSKKITYKSITHKVKRGESLSVVAHYYGKTSSEVKKYNKLRSSSVMVGQKIKIPPMTQKLEKHKVRSGESLSVIAHQYGVKAKILKAFNNLRSSELAIGQVLKIPVS